MLKDAIPSHHDLPEDPSVRSVASRAAVGVEENVRHARAALLPVLVAFEGLKFMDLVPGMSSVAPVTEGAVDQLTADRIPLAIAALHAWRRAHPAGAFEVGILIAKLGDLLSALVARYAVNA